MQSMAQNIKIRLGLDCARKSILEMGVPILVSANSLWDAKASKFKRFSKYAGLDVALDSSGFVAMKLYGGYRWSATEYAALALKMMPVWWAQMDYCCEPEIAANRKEVESRITKTIEGLSQCNAAAREIGLFPPMPVLQGYEPSDYVHGPIYGQKFPDLIGVGSVCRRSLKGRNGLMAVFDRIHSAVPQHVTLHLFGVKGSALAAIVREFPNRQITSDSMAYQFSARIEARKTKQPKTGELLRHHAESWLKRNEITSSSQAQLL